MKEEKKQEKHLVDMILPQNVVYCNLVCPQKGLTLEPSGEHLGN